MPGDREKSGFPEAQPPRVGGACVGRGGALILPACPLPAPGNEEKLDSNSRVPELGVKVLNSGHA